MDSNKVKDYITEHKLAFEWPNKQTYKKIENKAVVGYWIDEYRSIQYLNLIVAKNLWYMICIQLPTQSEISGPWPLSQAIAAINHAGNSIIESDFPIDLAKQLVVMRLEK